MRNGLSDEQLEAFFIGSPEFIQDNGGQGVGWITSMYEKLLGRAPDQAGLNAWLNALQAGANPSAIALGFAASPEREGERITADYQNYLGAPRSRRVPYWVNAFEAGASNEDVVAGFVGSPEFFADHFDNIPDWLFIAYQEVLDRTPDNAGYQSWLTVL